MMLPMLCLALDNTIIAVPISRITDEFKTWMTLDDIRQPISSPLAFLFGRLYAIFNVETVFMTESFLFEIGSRICGSAPTSTALIIGWAISGLDRAGSSQDPWSPLLTLSSVKRDLSNQVSWEACAEKLVLLDHDKRSFHGPRNLARALLHQLTFRHCHDSGYILLPEDSIQGQAHEKCACLSYLAFSWLGWHPCNSSSKTT